MGLRIVYMVYKSTIALVTMRFKIIQIVLPFVRFVLLSFLNSIDSTICWLSKNLSRVSFPAKLPLSASLFFSLPLSELDNKPSVIDFLQQKLTDILTIYTTQPHTHTTIIGMLITG